jgi:hypothetical protein
MADTLIQNYRVSAQHVACLVGIQTMQNRSKVSGETYRKSSWPGVSVLSFSTYLQENSTF